MKTTFKLILILSVISVIYSFSNAQQLSKPKNVIIIIADGTGFNHLLATNFFSEGKAGTQKYDSFPEKFAVSTYPAKTGSYPDKLKWARGYDPTLAWESYDYLKQTCTESAAAATAIATGVKTYNNSIGMDLNYKPIINLTEVAKNLGKSAGVVSSVPFCHATPGGFVAHVESRAGYGDIAKYMLLNSRCDVIMGAGHPEFDDNGKPLNAKERFEFVGDSLFWIQLKKNGLVEFVLADSMIKLQDCNFDNNPDPWTLIENKQDFQKLMTGNTPLRVFGLAQVHTTLQQGRSGDPKANPFVVPFNQNVPTLAEMSSGALNVLDNNKKGFFLMIEAGAADWANHQNLAGRMVEELIDFNKTVDTVINWIETNSSWDETLLIVTADHETGFLMGPESEKPDKKFDPIVNNGKGKMPSSRFNSNNHTNSLVPFFAKGAGSEIYRIFADETDPIRARYLNNTEISQAIFILWSK